MLLYARRILFVLAIYCIKEHDARKKKTCSAPGKFNLPFGIDQCIWKNKVSNFSLLWQKKTKCSVLTAHKLHKSPSLNLFWSTLAEMLEDPEHMSAAFYRFMSIMISDDKKKNMNEFCNDWSQYVLPCFSAYLPGFIEIAEKDRHCCSDFTDVLDILNMIVPPRKWSNGPRGQVINFIDEVIDNVHSFFCTKRTVDLTQPTQTTWDTCGAIWFRQIKSTVLETDFQLLSTFVFPAYTIPRDSVCLAWQGKTYVDTASLRPAATQELGCCIHHMRPLIQQFTNSLEYLFGSSLEETLNGMVSLNVSPNSAKKQFVESLSASKSCQFENFCLAATEKTDEAKTKAAPVSSQTAPIFASGTLPPSSKDDVKVVPEISMHEPGCHDTTKVNEVVCKHVQQCVHGKYEICRSVCERGTIEVSAWMKDTLTFQRELAFDGPMCQAQIPATHNSAINAADGYGILDGVKNVASDCSKPWSYIKTDNQFLSITDQLELGVRFIELDTHFFNNDFNTGHCSGFFDVPLAKRLGEIFVKQLERYGHVDWDVSLLGCWPSLSGISETSQIKTKQHLEEIAAWVKKTDQFMILYIDDGIDITEQNKWPELMALCNTIFGDKIVPKKMIHAIEANHWHSAKFRDFISAGYRVLLLANAGTEFVYPLKTFCGSAALVKTQVSTIEPDLRTMKWSDVPIYTDQVFTRTYQEELRAFKINSDQKWSGPGPIFLTKETIPKFVTWNINLIAPDMIDTSKMKAMIWSFAQNEPKFKGPGAAVYINSEGRWFTEKTKFSKWLACYSASSVAWKVIPIDLSCPKDHIAAAPSNAFLNRLLMTAIIATQKTAFEPVQIAVYN